VTVGNDRSQRPGVVSRVVRFGVAALVAFGIFGAIGTFLVAEFLPGVIERIRGEPSVLFSLGYDDTFYSEGFLLVLPASREVDTNTFAGVDDCTSLRESGRQAGAADYLSTFLHLIAEGRTLKDVVIVGINARIVRRDTRATGALISCVSAGAVDVIALGLNLDEPEPVARSVNEESGKFEEPWFGQDSAVTLTKGELLPFRITATTKKSYVEWELEIRMIVDGEREEMVLDDDGEPFRTTGPLPRSSDYERKYEWAWHQQPPRLVVSKPSDE
jgi:hypothetical protein